MALIGCFCVQRSTALVSLQPHFRHPSVQRSMCLPMSLGKLRKLGGDRISMAHRFYLSQWTNVSDVCVWQCCAQGSSPFLRGAAPTARLCQNRLHLLVASGGVSHHILFANTSWAGLAHAGNRCDAEAHGCATPSGLGTALPLNLGWRRPQ